MASVSCTCAECDNPFVGGNSLARFCSSSCRQRAWSRANPGYMVEAQRRHLAQPAKLARRKAYMRAYNQRPDVIARRNERNQERYQNEPTPYQARSEAHRQSRLRFLNAIRTTCGCVDCGKDDGSLHFDHRPGVTKLFTIGNGWSRSWRSLVAEIEKCDVRCASCHAKRHDFGQWRRRARLAREAAA